MTILYSSIGRTSDLNSGTITSLDLYVMFLMIRPAIFLAFFNCDIDVVFKVKEWVYLNT